MTTRLWIYAGANGPSEPVSEEDLAELLRQGVITGETAVRPSDLISWAPLFTWLAHLAPPEPPEIPPVKGAWTDRKPHPWRRYFARLLDGAVVGGLTWFVVGAVFYAAAPLQAEAFFHAFEGPGGKIIDLMLTLLVSIPGNALIIGLTGVSLGKWLFGIKVVTPNGRPIGLVAAFAREIMVWFKGFGMGIPLVSLFTLFRSFSKLGEDGHSAWDNPKDRVLLHRPMNALQVTLIILAIPLLIAIRFGLILLSSVS